MYDYKLTLGIFPPKKNALNHIWSFPSYLIFHQLGRWGFDLKDLAHILMYQFSSDGDTPNSSTSSRMNAYLNGFTKLCNMQRGWSCALNLAEFLLPLLVWSFLDHVLSHLFLFARVNSQRKKSPSRIFLARDLCTVTRDIAGAWKWEYLELAFDN